MKKARKKKIERRKQRFPTIGSDAAELGVHRSHLYRVLTGKRCSRSLLSRYQALKRKTQQQKAARAA